jgi:hypothetical protein
MIGDTDFNVSKLCGMLPATASSDPAKRTATDNQTVLNVFVIGLGATLEPSGEREICASDRSQSGSAGSRAGARPRRLERAASVGRWKISDRCNGEFPLRWRMEGVGAARRCARLIYNTKSNCGIIPRSQAARPAEMSVTSASRRTPALPATPHYQFA